jgi:hypothetical protein
MFREDRYYTTTILMLVDPRSVNCGRTEMVCLR